MKKALCAAAALALMPSISNAQEFNPLPGVYLGAFGGGVWFLPSSTSVGGTLSATTGYAVGLVAGYDFVGPRVELEVVFGAIPFSANLPTSSFSGTGRQLQVMGKALYDFLPASAITPYVGVGAGVAFIDSNVLFGSTQFAYEGIVGLGWNLDSQWRIALEGRYIGTTSPSFVVNGQTVTYNNNNILAMVGAQYKFAPPAPPPPPQAPVVAPPSFMVFFDWDRSNLSQQALATIKQAADAFKAKGNARITATGHTDTSGPEAYNMALSLRRANAVKDALVREGVPAQAIAVIGRGEAGLLVKTADGVREPQNRRVEIVIQ